MGHWIRMLIIKQRKKVHQVQDPVSPDQSQLSCQKVKEIRLNPSIRVVVRTFQTITVDDVILMIDNTTDPNNDVNWCLLLERVKRATTRVAQYKENTFCIFFLFLQNLAR